MEPSSSSWNSPFIEGAYTLCGWIAFICWSTCFYPQVILNFRRKRTQKIDCLFAFYSVIYILISYKSVVGLNFNYVLLNNTKNTVYLIYNLYFYFSPAVQLEYHKKFGFQEMIPVAINDVASSIHSTLLTLFTLFQIGIYERGNQTFSKITLAIVSVVWLSIAVCFFVALPSQSWLWFLSILTTAQVCLTCIKFIPQALLNFLRKSTDGFSIGYVLLDFSGGTFNYTQMIIQSIDQNSLVNLYGNLAKVLLSLVNMFFSLLFMCQHYLLYPAKKLPVSSKMDDEQITEPLMLGEEITKPSTKSPNTSSLENV